MSTSRPLVILGLDVGDADAIEQWVAEGRLPAIGSIMKNGCWGRTSGYELLTEQGIWFSMFNGISRGKHGYYYFRQLEPGSYDLSLFNGSRTGISPLWKEFDRSGKRVAIIDVPDADIAKNVDGIQLPNWAIHNIHPATPACSWPHDALADIKREFGERMTIDNVLMSTPRQDKEILKRTLLRIDKKGKLIRHLLSKERYDLIAIVFAETHTGSHQFWKYRRESASGEGAGHPELQDAIRSIYEAIDREIAATLAQLPDDADVFIVSASGMEDHYPTIGLSESFCRCLGYQSSPPPSNGSMKPLDIARKLVPESLRIAISRHLPRMTQERLINDNFRNGTDWSRTSAFSIPSHYTSFFRVNLKGREPQGTVEPGAEYEATLARIEEDLKKLVDPHNNTPAIKQIVRKDVFGEDVHPALPDLFVVWHPSSWFRPRIEHPSAELSQPIPGFYRDSEHNTTGFFAAAGPSITGRGELADISLLDLAPTFLSILGEPAPAEMTGSVIGAMVGRRVKSEG